MGQPQVPQPVACIAGLLAGSEGLLAAARAELPAILGPLELVSPIWPFANTHYYERELGPEALRQFVSFAEPAAADRLAEIKLSTNALEATLAVRTGRSPDLRPVNIDPGYITLSNLVLATTKNRDHRIYLGQGIFAEVTLRYTQHAWQAWPWTYPDYAATTYHGYFTEVRTALHARIRPGAAARDKF